MSRRDEAYAAMQTAVKYVTAMPNTLLFLQCISVPHKLARAIGFSTAKVNEFEFMGVV